MSCIGYGSKMAFQLARSKGSEQNPVSIWRMARCGPTFFKIAPRSERKISIRSMSYKRRFEALKILKNLLAEQESHTADVACWQFLAVPVASRHSPGSSLQREDE
jgi:hypothetical protein